MLEHGLALAAGAAGGILVNSTGEALINRIGDALGWYLKPRQIVRVAIAEANAKIEARKILSQWDTEISDEAIAAAIVHRTEFRLVVEQVMQQVNMENIILKALSHLKDDALPQNIKDDWILNFSDKCRTVSDDDMQERWARLLASEANDPGHFSRKAVNIFDDLDAGDAKDFETYCRFICQVGAALCPFIILNDEGSLDDIYTEAGFDYGVMVRLSSLGLIETGVGPGVPLSINPMLTGVPERVPFTYYDKSVELPGPENGKMTTGCAGLSIAGGQLARLCLPAEPVEGFFEFVCNKWHTLHKTATLSQGGTAMSYLDSVPV